MKTTRLKTNAHYIAEGWLVQLFLMSLLLLCGASIGVSAGNDRDMITITGGHADANDPNIYVIDVSEDDLIIPTDDDDDYYYNRPRALVTFRRPLGATATQPASITLKEQNSLDSENITVYFDPGETETQVEMEISNFANFPNWSGNLPGIFSVVRTTFAEPEYQVLLVRVNHTATEEPELCTFATQLEALQKQVTDFSGSAITHWGEYALFIFQLTTDVRVTADNRCVIQVNYVDADDDSGCVRSREVELTPVNAGSVCSQAWYIYRPAANEAIPNRYAEGISYPRMEAGPFEVANPAEGAVRYIFYSRSDLENESPFSLYPAHLEPCFSDVSINKTSFKSGETMVITATMDDWRIMNESWEGEVLESFGVSIDDGDELLRRASFDAATGRVVYSVPAPVVSEAGTVDVVFGPMADVMELVEYEYEGETYWVYENVTKVVAAKGGRFTVNVSPEAAPAVPATEITFSGMPEDGSLINIGKPPYSFTTHIIPISIAHQPANATDAQQVTYQVINEDGACAELWDLEGYQPQFYTERCTGTVVITATLESGVSCSRTYHLLSAEAPEGLACTNTFIAGTTFPQFQFEINNDLGRAKDDRVTVDYTHINGTHWTETYKYSELPRYRKEGSATAFTLPFSFTEEHPEATLDQIGQPVVTARVSMEIPVDNGQTVDVVSTATLVPVFRKPSFDDFNWSYQYFNEHRPASFNADVMYLPKKGFTVGYFIPQLNVQETYNSLSGDAVPDWLTIEDGGEYYYTAHIAKQLDLEGGWDSYLDIYTLAQRSCYPDEVMERHHTRQCRLYYAGADNSLAYYVNGQKANGDLTFDNSQAVEAFVNRVKTAPGGMLWANHVVDDYSYALAENPDEIYNDVLDLLDQTKVQFFIDDRAFEGAEVRLMCEDEVIQTWTNYNGRFSFMPPTDGRTYKVEVYFPAYDKRYCNTFVSARLSNVYAINTSISNFRPIYYSYDGGSGAVFRNAELRFTDGRKDNAIQYMGKDANISLRYGWGLIKGFLYAEDPRNFYICDIPATSSVHGIAINKTKVRVTFDNCLLPLDFNPKRELSNTYALYDYRDRLRKKFWARMGYDEFNWADLTSGNTLVTVVDSQGETVSGATLNFACVDKDMVIQGEAATTGYDANVQAYQVSTDPAQHAQLIEVVAPGYQPMLTTMYLWNYDYNSRENRGKQRRHTIVLQQQDDSQLKSLELETLKRDGNMVNNEMNAAINADNLLMMAPGETLNYSQTADYATATKYMKDGKFGTEGWSGTKYAHLTGMMAYESTPDLTLTTADGAMLLQPTMKYINKANFTTFSQNYCQFDFDLTDQIADDATAQPVLKNGGDVLATLPTLHNHTVDLTVLNEASNIALDFTGTDLSKVDDQAASNGVDMKDMNKAFDKFNFQMPPVLPFTVSIERDGDYFSVRAVCEVNFLPTGPIMDALDKLDNLNYFDEQFQACMNAVNTAKPMDDDFFDDIPRFPSAFCGIKGFLSGIGHVNPETGKLDINFLDGGLTFEASARASANVSFFIGGFGMSVDAKIAMTMALVNRAAANGDVAALPKVDFMIDNQCRLKVCAWAYGGIDLWIAKATAGVRGGACIDVQQRAIYGIGSGNNQVGARTTLQARMEAYAEARFLWWTARKSWPILNAYKQYLMPNAPSNPFHPANDEPIFSFSRRNVTKGYRRLKRRVIADLGTPIINNVNGMAQPTYMLGGEALLFNNLKVPADYNDDRVQIYCNGSKADLVEEGIPDNAPMYDFAEAHNSNGLEMVAFEQVKKSLDGSELDAMEETDQIKDVTEKSQIYVAMRKDGGDWTTEVVGYYWGKACVTPAVAVQQDGKAAVIWQQGVAKFNDNGERYIDGSLMLSRYDGSSWGDAIEIKRLNRRSVPADYQVSMKEDSILVMMTLQQDVNNAMKQASVVYVTVSPSDKVREYYTQVQGSKPQMVGVDGANLVGFIKTTDEGRGIELSTVNMKGESTGKLTGLLDMKSRMVNDFRLIVDDEATDLSDVALLWSQGDQETTDNGDGTQTVSIKNRIYAAKLCSHDQQMYFSAPVEIATMPDDVTLVSMDGYLNDLDMKVAYCVTNEQDGGAVLETPVAFTNAIDHRVNFNAYEVTNEQQVPLAITVANNGFEPIDRIDVTMKGETTSYEVTLMPQETTELTAYYPVDDDFDGTIDYDVTANFIAGNSNALKMKRRGAKYKAPRRVVSQTGTQMDVRQVDMALKVLSKKTDANGVTTIVAEVNNASLLPLSADMSVKVGLYDGTLSTTAVGQEVTVTASDLYDADGKQNKVKIVTLTANQPDFDQMLYLRTTPMANGEVVNDVRPANNVLPVRLVGKYILGDANNDGKVSVADVTAVINRINGSTSGTFIEKAANVNRDEKISIADVTGIINIINK